MSPGNVLALDGVRKAFGSIAALRDVTLAADEGEIIGLLGENGSGKSTLLRLIAGLLRPDGGAIAWWGQHPLDRRSFREIGVLFDHLGHWDPLTGYENAWYFARSYGLPPGTARARLDMLFERFELRKRQDDPVATYSYGMRRKLALIEVLAHTPRLLLLDEPSMGLDYHARLTLYTLLQDAAESGATVIFASNDMHEAAALATRVVLLQNGQVIAAGAPPALIRSLDRAVRIDLRLTAPIPTGWLRMISGVEGVSEETDGAMPLLRVLGRTDSGDGSAALLARVVTGVVEQGGKIGALEVSTPSLGDLFLQLREDKP
ncbi:MAG: ABC transporter ATP-binding protein [Methanospirillum sp.]